MITMMMTLMMMMAIKIGGSVDDVVEEEVRSGRASFLGSLNESSDDKVTTMVESCGTMTSKESTNAGSLCSMLIMVSKTPKKTNTKKAATVCGKPRALGSGKDCRKKGEDSSIVDLMTGGTDSVVHFSTRRTQREEGAS